MFFFQSSDNKKRWSVVSIFNRIGISKKFLGDSYDKIVDDINQKSEGMTSSRIEIHQISTII